MQQEIDSLKEYIRNLGSGTTGVPAASQNSAPEIPRDSTPFQDLPQDHISNQDASYPLFVQGSSTDSAPYHSNGILNNLGNTDENVPYTRKRTTSPSSGDDESSEDDELSNAQRPSKRINGHDTRCLTIQVYGCDIRYWSLLLIIGLFQQHAMRSHLNRLMSISDDDSLPTNHIEGAPLADDEPVRFIWARTIKKSQHNTRMKERVINDLIENRGLYEHVSQDDFTADNLDMVFDQTFSTLRSRYKAQTDANVAQKRREKEINKMIKTRRANRKRAVSVLDFSVISGGWTHRASRNWNCAPPVVRRTNLILTRLSMGLSNWNACLRRNPRMMVLSLGTNHNRGRADEHQSLRSFVCGVPVGEVLDWLNYSISWTKPGRMTPSLVQPSPAETKASRR